MILPALLLVAVAGIVGHTVASGRTIASGIVARIGHGSRSRMIAGWALGTLIAYGLPALAALALLGRAGAIAAMPDELVAAAHRLGLPGRVDTVTLAILGGEMALGIALGITILLVRRWMGRPPIGLRYRSPAAAQHRGEWGAAALLSLSAGVSEELFFRLLLPLLIALVSGNAVAGFVIGLIAFVALHRHQGWGGMIGVTLVGVALTALYLSTGRLWTAMLLHVLIDLNAFILRPAIAGGTR